MNLSNRIAMLASCGAIFISASAMAQLDASSLRSSSSRNSASYESGRSTGSRMGFTGPEGSGRPGIFFFKKGVNAFEKDQTAFAINMYEVSAAWAYKPAQYNLSVIYSRGQGVPVNLPRAMAWIALAAERGDSRYVDARDAINAKLTSEQVVEANRILDELKPKYADARALRRATHRWRDAKLDA
ncbi:MAG: SEL1-like repeat protein, partial [Dokdonella sp.]